MLAKPQAPLMRQGEGALLEIWRRAAEGDGLLPSEKELAHLPLATGMTVVDALAWAVLAERPELELGLLDDIAKSVARARVGRLAILNGHGGNTHLLRVAAREIPACYGLKVFLLHGSLPPDNGGPGGDPPEEGLGVHGGLAETWVML